MRCVAAEATHDAPRRERRPLSKVHVIYEEMKADEKVSDEGFGATVPGLASLPPRAVMVKSRYPFACPSLRLLGSALSTGGTA